MSEGELVLYKDRRIPRDEYEAIIEIEELIGKEPAIVDRHSVMNDFEVMIEKNRIVYLRIDQQGLKYIPKQVSKLKKLRELALFRNKIQKIEHVGSLSDLQVLWLSENQIQKIEGLENLKNLRSLGLFHNQIQKIEGLDNLYNLHRLNIYGNKIEKIEGLEHLQGLKEIILTYNKISVIEGLPPNLEALEIHGDKKKKFKIEELPENLQDFRVSYDIGSLEELLRKNRQKKEINKEVCRRLRWYIPEEYIKDWERIFNKREWKKVSSSETDEKILKAIMILKSEKKSLEKIIKIVTKEYSKKTRKRSRGDRRKIKELAEKVGRVFYDYENVSLNEVKYLCFAKDESKLAMMFNEQDEELKEVLNILLSNSRTEYEEKINFLNNLALEKADKIKLEDSEDFYEFCEDISLPVAPIRKAIGERLYSQLKGIHCPRRQEFKGEYTQSELETWLEQMNLPSIEDIKYVGKSSEDECHDAVYGTVEDLIFKWDMNKFTKKHKPYLKKLKEKLVDLINSGEKLGYNMADLKLYAKVVDRTLNKIILHPETMIEEMVPVKPIPQERVVKVEEREEVKEQVIEEEPEKEMEEILQ